jgi:DNA-binding IscR family transcriptional regulator
MVDVISFLDGTLTMEEVAEESRTTMEFVAQVCELLSREGLIAY